MDGQNNGEPVLTFVVASDIHAGPGSESPQCFGGVCEAIARVGKGAFLISPGDMGNQAHAKRIIDEHMGKDTIWYLGMGNHDVVDVELVRSIRAYNSGGNSLPHIVNPGPENGREAMYSFDYANCHFVMLNEYYDGEFDCTSEAQIRDALYDWLAADLDATDKQHIFVFGHEPAFYQVDLDFTEVTPSGGHLGHADPRGRDRFWRLLRHKGVVAYVCGHHHLYHHTRINGVWQIVAGHSRGTCGLREVEGRSTFVRVHVSGDRVTFDTYRDSRDGGPYHLYDSGVLVSPDGNELPVADAGPRQSVVDDDGDGEATVTLDGSGSYDPDGTIRSYVWKRGNKEIATEKVTRVTLGVGYYKDISLTVTDDRGAHDNDVAYIWVKPKGFEGQPLVPDAGPDQTITLPECAHLEGCLTYDGAPIGKIKITWSRLSGPGPVSFGRAYILKTTAGFSNPGTYVLQLRAFYADGELEGSDTMTVTVKPEAGDSSSSFPD